MHSFEDSPPPELSVEQQPEAASSQPVMLPPMLEPLPVIPRPPIDDGKNAVVDLLDVLFIILFGLGAYFFCGMAATVIYMLRHPGQNPQDLARTLSHNAFFVVALQFVVYLMLVGFMAFLVWVRHRTPLAEAIRWNLPAGRRIINLLGTGVALALCSDLAEALLHRWIPKSLPITEFFQDRASAFWLAGFGVLVAPLVEEMVFRGFLYPALSRRTGMVPSILITSAGFALLHGAQLAYSFVPLMLIFTVGAVLTIVRASTKSVASSVLVHMAYHFTLFFQFYLATQGFRNLQG
jgi:CAAX protease family protein